MASENEGKYGVLAGTVVNEAEKGVKDTVDTVKQTVGMVERVGGFLKRDIGNGINWLTASPEEKAAKKAEEQAEKEKKAEEEKKAAEAEAQRLKDLQKSYIVHTAVILCSCAVHESFAVVPISHGEFIHGIAQLNVGDSKPNVNIRNFGICQSPNNPSVQAAAKKILDEVNSRPKSFFEKVMDLFSKPPAKEASADLASKCAGVCDPQIFTEWIDGKEDVLMDGKPSLLGRCKLQCAYGGEITLYTSGQKE
ncbi:hypothetical protein CLPUN_27910 [Clostridium puniceum]|uniref:DUF4280 domain-containing protein n=1 Tax=Clostridium puniceum TaxID=29367 RepID=A0A1S8TEP0_9CLOT|nr:DUF4280 domain-containing protein [Clostridium puniceum]OOM76178.1 hypothetical protein CLPUN_27910 [Clostridium puniceum]